MENYNITASLLAAARDLAIAVHSSDATGHDFHHVERVVAMARHIAMTMNDSLDLPLVELVCWLHDVDDPKLNHQGNDLHLPKFLDDNHLSRSLKVRVTEIISALSYSASKSGIRETTLEGQIAQDADRLDAIGAIGIARAFAFGGAKGRPLVDPAHESAATRTHFDEKLFKLEGLMNTAEGKRIAAERTKFMRSFIQKFDEETGV